MADAVRQTSICVAHYSRPTGGERALEPEALTLRHFLVHTVAHELLHVDGTLWRTLRLLFVRAAALLVYVLSALFMSAVQAGGAAVALALA
jgi:hypothetical protein